jgi:hypothetical protein
VGGASRRCRLTYPTSPRGMGQATMYALARWEGSGVWLGATFQSRLKQGGGHSQCDVAPGPGRRSPGGQPRARLAGRLWGAPPSRMLAGGGGHITSF